MQKEILGYTNLYGLIGYPLSHSFSKKYFGDKFEREGITDCFYELFPIERIEDLPALINSLPNLRGLNVTIPYKEQVVSYLDELDESAKGVMAVNVIRVESDRLIGYNSDVYGFDGSLQGLLDEESAQPSGALVLGTGGASKAVAYVLEKRGLPFHFVSRRSGRNRLTYEELTEEIMNECSLIINTTPLGMSPKLDSFPDIPYHYLGEKHLLFDLVYNPEETTFMRKGKERGCATINGLKMLYLQAEKAWEIWQ